MALLTGAAEPSETERLLDSIIARVVKPDRSRHRLLGSNIPERQRVVVHAQRGSRGGAGEVLELALLGGVIQTLAGLGGLLVCLVGLRPCRRAEPKRQGNAHGRNNGGESMTHGYSPSDPIRVSAAVPSRGDKVAETRSGTGKELLDVVDRHIPTHLANRFR